MALDSKDLDALAVQSNEAGWEWFNHTSTCSACFNWKFGRYDEKTYQFIPETDGTPACAEGAGLLERARAASTIFALATG